MVLTESQFKCAKLLKYIDVIGDETPMAAYMRLLNKYDYSLVHYNGIRVEVQIICPKHGEFLQTPNGHLIGHGCRKCANEKLAEIKTLTGFAFPCMLNSTTSPTSIKSDKSTT